MNGFYQLSVFSLLENIARRTAAKRWGMQSTIEQFFGTDLGTLLDKSAVQLVSIFFCTNICPAVLECFSIVQLSASASKSFPVLQEL